MADQIVDREVHLPGKTVQIKAYAARPAGASSDQLPAVIVVQEWWGLNPNIHDITRRVAREGYFAVAPDLYSRQGHKVATDPNTAGQLMAGLKKEDGIEDLLATIGWIKTQKE